MAFFKKIMLIFLFVAGRIYSAPIYTNPTTVPANAGPTPSISPSGWGVSGDAPIACSSDGQYIYTSYWTAVGPLVQGAINYGVTWNTATVCEELYVSPNTNNTVTRIACDPTGQYVCAVYAQVLAAPNRYMKVMQSSDYGATWSGPTTLATSYYNTTASETYKLIMRSDEGPIETYLMYSPLFIAEIYLIRYMSGSWGAPITVSVGGGTSRYPTFCASSDGVTMHMLYVNYTPDPPQLYTMNSSDTGANWVNNTALDTALYFDRYTSSQIVCSSTGDKAHAIWVHDSGGGALQVQTKSYVSAAWGSAADLTAVGTGGDHPQIACSSNGAYVFAVYEYSDGSNTRIGFSTSSDSGTTWSASPTAISDAGQNATTPQISCDSTGQNVFAIWKRSDGSNLIAQTKQSSDYGVTWAFPASTPIGTGTADLTATGEDVLGALQIVNDSTGTYIHPIWEKNVSGELRVQTCNGGPCTRFIPPFWTPTP